MRDVGLHACTFGVENKNQMLSVTMGKPKVDGRIIVVSNTNVR